MLRKCILATLSAVFIVSAAKAQDPEFSQFYAAPLYLNPAFAGNGGPKVNLNYRNQWPGIKNAYTTVAASYDQFVPSLNGGIGVLVTTDKQGPGSGYYNSTNITGIYSYQIKAGDNFVIKPALGASYCRRQLNTNGLIYEYDPVTLQPIPNSQINDQTANNVQPPANFFDFNAGLLLYSENFFAGLAVDHLTQPNQSVTDAVSILPTKITTHVGAVIPLDGTRSRSGLTKSISPNVMYQKQGPFNQLNLGMYYNAGPLVLGGWYRYSFTNGDAVIALIGFKAGIVHVGYSYDYNTSKLSNSLSAGAHEVSFSVEFDRVYRRSSAKFKKINCPTF